MLTRSCALIGVLIGVSLGGADVARAELFLAADSRGDESYLTLTVIGLSYADVEVYERVDGAYRRLAAVNLGEVPGGGFGRVILSRAVRWRCDRLTRSFGAIAHNPNGTQEATTFSVRTPSCRDRLRVTVPRAARRGALVPVTVRDSWKIGGVRGRLCTTAPGRRARCRLLRIGVGKALVRRGFRPRRKGDWRIEVRAPDQRIRRTVSVGTRAWRRGRGPALPTILTTGDSLMQSISPLLADRLAGRVRVRNGVRPASGISKPQLVEWRALARRQVARFRPDATIMFLGANDAFPMLTPAGSSVECCGEPWIAEYARRVGQIMTTYARGGTSEVFWLNLPAPRAEVRRAAMSAVNAAVLRAAAAVPDVYVVPLDQVFTPGGLYRDAMLYGGRSVRIREGDGIHLSVAGSAIATTVMVRFLELVDPQLIGRPAGDG